MLWIIPVSLLVGFIYFFVISRFYYGWKKLKINSDIDSDTRVSVSVIIPFRNERDKISENFNSLLNQDYPVSFFEIIYINDHSDDNTCELLREMMKNASNVKLVHLSSFQSGKKDALLEGVKIANGEFLLFTDADCYPVRSWIRTMADFYIKYKPVMISGPVLLKDDKRFLSRFQALELMSLVGTGAGSFGIRDPILCNAANMGFQKEIYLQYKHKIKPEISSGDDIFILLFLKNMYASRLLFLKSCNSIVYTDPADSISKFLAQRIRWVSKSKHYHDSLIIFTALSVLGVNLTLLILIILLTAHKTFLITFIIVLLTKVIIDFCFLRSICIFFGRRDLLRIFIPSEILYLPYSIFSALAGNFLIPLWKGRKLNNG